MNRKDLKALHLVLIKKYVLLSIQKNKKESDMQLSLWIYPNYTQLHPSKREVIPVVISIEEKSFILLWKIMTKLCLHQVLRYDLI